MTDNSDGPEPRARRSGSDRLDVAGLRQLIVGQVDELDDADRADIVKAMIASDPRRVTALRGAIERAAGRPKRMPSDG
jgi:hypothetical protein